MPLFHPREKRLKARARRASGQILSSEPTHHVVERGSIEQLVARRWRLSVHVELSTAAAFDTTFEQVLDSWSMPWRGDRTTVLYDPADPSSASALSTTSSTKSSDDGSSACPPGPEAGHRGCARRPGRGRHDSLRRRWP